MGMRIHLKVRGKLLVPILSVVFLGILALLTFVYLQSASLLEAQIQEGITLESQAASRAMQDWIEGRKDDVGNWARNSGYHRVLTGQPGGFEDAMRTLSGKIADFPYYESVNLLDLSGKVVASGDPERVGLDLSERDYFKQAAAGEVACSKPLLSKVSGNPVFVIAAPVKSPEGRVEGVLAGVFKIDRMTGIFTDSIKIGENGYAFVIDSEGLVIGHPNRDFIMKLDVADTEFGKVMLQQKSGVYKYWFEQQSQWKMMGFSEIPATGWIVAVTAPLTELLAPLVRVRDLALLGGLLTVVLAGLIIFFFVGRVTKVLGSAAEHLRELAEGNVERDVDGKSLQSGDELGDMARAFRSMVEAQRARAELAQAIASGDLRQRVEVASDKDRLGKALDEMVRSLNDIIGQIGVAAEQVREGSGQVSESSQALSQGATEQASSLEEITSSVTEISSQTRTNAENASQANQLASQARDSAREGDGEMREMVAAMEEINQSSQAINKIIKVIDEIAFQTNLLALNAAVEAARAGSHGKGFAVVAEEVRNLASRSAKAAQETAQLIEGSVVKVDKGGSMAKQTAESLREIVEKITKVADIVADIAAASDEQAKGVGQINIGLSQIDQVTQQNTANAEETASASEELSSQAVEMRRLVGRFRLVEGPGRGPVAALDAAPPRREARQLPPAPQRRTPMRSASGQGSAGPERAGASASQDASRGAWGDVPARKAASGRAAGARPADPELVRPEEVISLDDNEFGRY